MDDLKSQIVAFAADLGFDDCRIAPAAPARHGTRFQEWLAEGKQGDMEWFTRNVERRPDPTVVVPGARSVIVLAMNYWQGHDRPEPDYRIARYAWNDDYHDLITRQLKALHALLAPLGGEHRYYVDTGPVLERDFASEAGLGWGGKSTMQIHRRLGTWFFLAEIITTLDLQPDSQESDHCGSCTRCITASPTQAITAPRRMDPLRCISYYTIEHKDPIPLEFRRAMGSRIYGCDDCLDACPWNRFATATRQATFHARQSVFQHHLRDFLDTAFRTLFAKSPIKRIKRPAFLRNVCVALGNVGTTADLPALQHAAADPDPLISEHATWAISEITERPTTTSSAERQIH